MEIFHSHSMLVYQRVSNVCGMAFCWVMGIQTLHPLCSPHTVAGIYGCSSRFTHCIDLSIYVSLYVYICNYIYIYMYCMYTDYPARRISKENLTSKGMNHCYPLVNVYITNWKTTLPLLGQLTISLAMFSRIVL